MPKPRVKVPKSVKAGSEALIKTLLRHPMEAGTGKYKKGPKKGQKKVRNMIEKFQAAYNGQVVFSMDLQGGISANPYIAFKLKPTKSGKLEMTWHQTDGKVFKVARDIKVG